jgi:hypothetical protein
LPVCSSVCGNFSLSMCRQRSCSIASV